MPRKASSSKHTILRDTTTCDGFTAKQTQAMTIKSPALEALHKVTIPTARRCDDAEIRVVVGIDSPSPMISVGISVHVVIGIHGAGPYHRTPKGIHGNVRGLVGWDSMVPRVSIAGLLRHGTSEHEVNS